MKTLLFEIGSEEIPASYIEAALDDLADFLKKELKAERIAFGEIKRFSTPRRLALLIEDMAESQAPEKKELMGPPVKAAFDAEGKPLVPAVKFAERAGLPLDKIEIRKTEKGDYLFALIEEKTEETIKVLAGLLPVAVKAISFPKRMRWADSELSFARPITGFLALFGEDIVDFKLEGMSSDRKTLGHRFHHPEICIVDKPENYEEILERAFVIADLDKRRKMIKEAIDKLAGEAGARIYEDKELLDINAKLVESVHPVLGSFDADFLELPEEVLITSMREHQKYFALEDENSKLLPAFIALNNTDPLDMDLVKKGHERVLKARLSDARFFWEEDKKVSFEERNEKLKSLLFQAKLGSMAEKVERLRKLSAFISDKLDLDKELKADIDRAALLSKADLVSNMVYEFPEVQGIMGRAYALLAGENKRTAFAIEDHYKPLSSSSELPRDKASAVLAIADKLDTLCGCFALGLRPTGAADPFALRRATLGIIDIISAFKFPLSLSELASFSLELFKDKVKEDSRESLKAILDFIRTRLLNSFMDKGMSRDSLMAVLAVEGDFISRIEKRALALDDIRKDKDFNALAAAFKRVVNILKKAEAFDFGLNPSLFEEEAEKNLYQAIEDCKAQLEDKLKNEELDKALMLFVGLGPFVDAFFDDVMVMVEDEALRLNRLGLLASIARLFYRIADFSFVG